MLGKIPDKIVQKENNNNKLFSKLVSVSKVKFDLFKLLTKYTDCDPKKTLIKSNNEYIIEKKRAIIDKIPVKKFF